MSKVLIRAAIIILGLATMGSVNARALNHHHPHPGYTGWASSSPSSVGSWEFVPGRGVVGESCDMPSSTCSNDERIND